MSSSDDNQDPPSTLPSPELNPLTNPVLGRNMGRWAEVYFTSAPEKREEAVRELLRELESEPPAAEDTPVASAPLDEQQKDEQQKDGQQKTDETDPPEEAPAGLFADSFEAVPPQEQFTQCSECGRIALPEQQFCGECGSPLPVREATQTDKEKLAEGGGEPYENTELLRSRIAEAAPALFLEHQYERQRRSRWTMALALTILLGTLFYVAARETSAWLSAHNAPRTATPEPAAQDRPTPPPSTVSPEAPAPTAPQSEAPNAASTASPAGSSATRAAGKRNSFAAKDFVADSSQPGGPRNVKNEKPPPTTGAGGRGAEELAIAESYLSGTQGKARDSREAAEWLWKSVGKQNGAAALLLSDLYVTGDGVARNCDQARLLLDAAAVKGTPGAGERIRDLPNLGCQ